MWKSILLVTSAAIFATSYNAQSRRQAPVLFPATPQAPANENIQPLLKDAPRRPFPRNDSSYFVVGPIRGSVKNTAIVLQKPDYSEAAMLAGTEGVVRARIAINEEGIMTSVEVLDGDPLLRAEVEKAIAKSRFRPLIDASGKAVNSGGILNYPFEIRKMNWSVVASSLVMLGTSPASNVAVPAVAKSFDSAWTEEIALAKELGNIAPTPARLQATAKSDLTYKSNSAAASRAFVISGPSQRHKELAGRLIESIRGRLADDDRAAWQFGLGLDLVSAFFISSALPTPRNPTGADPDAAAEIIRNRLSSAPAGMPAEVASALKNLEKSIAQRSPDRTAQDKIAASIQVILNAQW